MSKRYKAIAAKVDRNKLYPLNDALSLVKENAVAKFDESIDVAINLGIDAKKSDQLVRGSVVLPKGTGKTMRVAVFSQGAKAEEAKAAGADIVGFEDLAESIKGGTLDFDVLIASPDAMRLVGQLPVRQLRAGAGVDEGDLVRPRGIAPQQVVCGVVVPWNLHPWRAGAVVGSAEMHDFVSSLAHPGASPPFTGSPPASAAPDPAGRAA